MLPEEPDSSGSISEISSSSSRSTSLPTTTTSSSAKAGTTELSSPGMFAALLAQLRAELAEERRRREALEARQRELAVHLYCVVDEQIRGVAAIKRLVQSVRDDCREDRTREIIAAMRRMRAAWGRKPRTRSFDKRMRKSE